MEPKIYNKRLKNLSYVTEESINLLKKYNIHGFYIESADRSVCSCGYVNNTKLYVCPECGNQSFIEANWKTIFTVPETAIVFDKASKEIRKMQKTLSWKYGVSTQKEILIQEEHNKIFSISETKLEGIGYRRDLSKEDEAEILNIIEENKTSFSKPFLKALELAKEIKPSELLTSVIKWREIIAFPAKFPKANAYIKDLKGKNNSLLIYLLSETMNTYSGVQDSPSIKQLMTDKNIPSILEPYLSEKILNDFGRYSGYYGSRKEDPNTKFNKIPDDIKNIIVHYYLEGLISKDSFCDTPFISERLLEINSEVQKIQMKKYFPNFKAPNRYYYHRGAGSANHTLDDMIDFYINNNLPIDQHNFDFKNYCAMLNNEKIAEAGWDESTINLETANIETEAAECLIRIATTRRKRKKDEE